MSLSTEQCLAAIEEHSRGLADAARGHLDAPVEHCPGWTVADLVAHVAEVHWFWGTIAGELLAEPPAEERRPARSPDDTLVEDFAGGAASLVTTLRGLDQAAACWTWAPQRDVAFVTRHQVQEAAVHHWDAAHATGTAWTIDDEVAADSVDEFLAFSVSTDEDPVERPALDGALLLRTPERSWFLTDGGQPGTVRTSEPPADVPDGTAVADTTATDALLWLYARVPDAEVFPDADTELLARFRALCFTD